MAIAALVVWVITALGGSYLLAKWVAGGGPRRESPTKVPPALLVGHFFLAAVGLVLWIIYVALDETSVGWIAFIALVPVALLGFAMFARWIPAHRNRSRDEETSRHHFPVAVVGAHGVLAVATLVLVLLTNLHIGTR
ncbi:MAG TPA: hypothetical protein VFB19_02770 [Mycobacterium sp.]|nr:hypothetical protein [Mycobacterium sp.]